MMEALKKIIKIRHVQYNELLMIFMKFYEKFDKVMNS